MNQNKLLKFIMLIIVLNSCKRTTPNDTNVSNNQPLAVASKTLVGPLLECKVYKLFNGYSSSDDFEASGVFAKDGEFNLVFDNRYKIGKINKALIQNSSLNIFIGSGSGSSNFEGITFDPYNTPNWYVVEESVKNGNVAYNPRIREYDKTLNYQSSQWCDYNFNSTNNNKAFEGVAYVRRNNQDYILSIVEGTGKIVVNQQNGNIWKVITEFSLPVTFKDYSDIAIFGNKLAVTSQEDAQIWIGNLHQTLWTYTGSWTVYDFPKGDKNGTVGAGNLTLYGNIEGVSFINDSTIVTCSDKASSSQPSYQNYKDQSVQIFRIR
jgi:hypothetical protein